MGHTVASIEVRKRRGKIVVLAIGRTAREQKYLKSIAVTNVTSMAAPELKGEIAAAVAKLLE